MKWSALSYGEEFYIPYTENQRAVRGFLLRTLGIDLENIPRDFFEPCLFYDKENKHFGEYRNKKVHVRDIIGTSYADYAGDTWIIAFLKIKRAHDYIVNGNVTRGKYFRMLKRPVYEQDVPVHLTHTKQGYFIDSNGNHRITMYKMMYLAELSSQDFSYEPQPQRYWLYAKVREELGE